MIKYLTHSEIDKEKWDRCIADASNGLIYAYSWYLDIVSSGWSALVENEYENVMPLVWNKKYSIQYIFPPFFVQQLGLFSIARKISKEKTEEFINHIPNSFKFIEMNLNVENDFGLNGFKIKPNLTHHLSFDKPYKLLTKFYSNNVQRNIAKAKKADIKIVKGSDWLREIINLFRKNKGREISTLKDKHFLMFEQLVAEANKHNAFKIYASVFEGKICAGVIFFESNNKIILIFSGVNETGKKTGAMHLLIDTFIHETSLLENKNLILDFEGSNNPTLARFYKSFGSTEKRYLKITKNNLPKAIRWIKSV